MEFKTTVSQDPGKLMESIAGKNAIFELPDLDGPANPLLIEAQFWEQLGSVLEWALGLSKINEHPLAALQNQAGMKPKDGMDEIVAQALATTSLKGLRGQAAEKKLAEAIVRTASSKPNFAKGPQQGYGSSGVSFMPVKSAWDYAAKSSAGAQMAVLWQAPETKICNFAIVATAAAQNIRSNLFKCDTVVPRENGFVSMSYEQGKLGPTDGPAIQQFDKMGIQSAPPTFYLEGKRVSPDVHAAGRLQPFSGESLAQSIIASVTGVGNKQAFQLPGGPTNANVGGMESEMLKAESSLKNWLNANEPELVKNERARNMARAAELIRSAVNDISGTRKDLGDMQKMGIQTVGVDFSSIISSPGGFAPSLRTVLGNTPGLFQTMGIGAGAQGKLEFGAKMAEQG